MVLLAPPVPLHAPHSPRGCPHPQPRGRQRRPRRRAARRRHRRLRRGKSSLALDTLYAEGQRRFVESFSPYARQFLERLERPPMDALEPVAAGVAVDRRARVKSSRSTVATMADLEAVPLRALHARGAPGLPGARRGGGPPRSRRGRPTRCVARTPAPPAIVTYPVRVARHRDLPRRAGAPAEGRLPPAARRRRGARRSTSCGPREAMGAAGQARGGRRSDDARAKDTRGAAGRGAGAGVGARGTARRISGSPDGAGSPCARGLVCPTCARAFEPARPGLFSYQSPLGACPACRGFGRTIGIDWDKVDPRRRR